MVNQGAAGKPGGKPRQPRNKPRQGGATQGGPPGKREGFAAKKQGFNPKQQGFHAKKQGFNPKQQGFDAKKQGFSPKKKFHAKGKGPQRPRGPKAEGAAEVRGQGTGKNEAIAAKPFEGKTKKQAPKPQTPQRPYMPDSKFEEFAARLAAAKPSGSETMLPIMSKWYSQEEAAPLPVEESFALTEAQWSRLRNMADKAYENEVAAFDAYRKQKKGGEERWIRTVLTSGTLTDKVAAHTLLVQESPVHNSDSLKHLVNMVKGRGHREAQKALESVRDLFEATLLPDRKLNVFEKQAIVPDKVTMKHLLLWGFEDGLKKLYAEFAAALANACNANLEFFRMTALGAVADLLIAKPEQEQALLTILVNKMGDPLKKVASRSTFLLQRLIEEHAAMKKVVVQEVRELLMRPNISHKAQYYALIFLNQIVLHRSQPSLANLLISVYLTVFQRLTGQGASELRSKLMSALLTGVNRALPFADYSPEELRQISDTLFTIANVGTFSNSIQALMLLFQVWLCWYFSQLGV